jgi:putative endonuclease
VRKKLGALGENLAGKLLKNKGYRLLSKNFRCRFGEIDLVALEGKDLVFIEVKTRLSDHFGRPEESVTSRKIRQLKRLGLFYRSRHPSLPESLRIDVLALYLTPDKKLQKFELFKNITADL